MANLGSKVSAISENSQRSYGRLVPQAGSPPLDTEWILIQEILDNKNRDVIKQFLHSGFLDIGEVIPYDESLNTELSNTIRFKSNYALVNGWLLKLGGGTSQVQPGSNDNVWNNISNDLEENIFIMEDSPSLGSREDLVYLEVWEELIDGSDQLYVNGNTQWANSNFTNDVIHPDSGNTETSKRTQIRFAIRTAVGVDFFAFKQGLGHSSIAAQGPGAEPNFTYTFTEHATDKGLWVAGTGDSSTEQLGTVDGYIYSIPLFRVHRRNKSPYTPGNPNGNSSKIEDQASDRPDNLFYDGIVSQDLEDLRHLVKLSYDLENLADENFQYLMENTLDTRLIQGENPDLVGSEIIQFDGISNTDRTDINDQDFRNPNNAQRKFSDKESAQRTVLDIENATLNGSNELEVSIPQPYTDPTLDPWMTSEFFPKVYNVNSGGLTEIAGDSSFGINGWEGLDDRLHVQDLKFKPAVPSEVTGEDIIVEYDLIWPGKLGMTYRIESMLDVENEFTTEKIAHTNKMNATESINLTDLRSPVGGFTDTGISRSINSFVENSNNEIYAAGIKEITFYDSGNGTNLYTTDLTVYGHKVIGVYRVYNVSQDIDANVTQIILNANDTYTLSFDANIPTTTILRFTLLLAGEKIDWEGPTKSVDETAATEVIEFDVPTLSSFTSSNGIHYIHDGGTGTDTFILNLRKRGSALDTVLAAVGFYKETGTFTELDYQVFVDNSKRSDIVISGYGTPFLVVTFSSSSGASGDEGSKIKIPVLGLKPFTSSDLITLQYNYKPYRGISSAVPTTSTIETEVLYVSDKTLITSSGTGVKESITIPENLKGISTSFPINKEDVDGDFNGEDIVFPHTTPGSIKFVNRDYLPITETSDNYKLLKGDLTAKRYGSTFDLYNTRGAHLESPNISEGTVDLINELTEDVSSQADGSNKIFTVSQPIVSINNTEIKGSINNVTLPINKIDIKVYVDSLEVSIFQILGKDKKVILDSAPANGTEVIITYNTATSHMNAIYGICKGLTENTGSELKSYYPDELLLFVLTTTSDTEHLTLGSTADDFKLGTGNQVIFNNNIEIETSPKNEANRLLGAVDFYRIKKKPLIKI